MSSNEEFTKEKQLELWEELKVLVESVELDMVKNINGNKSAGLRVRKGLRLVKQKTTDLVKTSLESDRQ